MPPDARSIGAVASGQDGQPDRRGQADLDRQDGGQGTQGPRGGQLGRASRAGIVVARPFGIPVLVSPYWFVIAGVFIVIYANDLSNSLHGNVRFVVAAAFVVLLYLSVLVHELAHSVVARGYGLPVRRILLYPLGGISEIDKEPQTPAREFCVSAAGPALSLALGGGRLGALARRHGRGERLAGPAADVREHHRRHLQPAARAAAGRRPDAARRHLEDHR